MLLTFTSITNQSGKENKIEFTSRCEISKYNEFDVYEFVEPTQNVQNRIEVSNDSVNVFAGPTTVNLKLDQTLKIQYDVGPRQFIFLDATMTKLSNVNNQIEFNYFLVRDNKNLGNFEIKLSLREEN